MRSTPPFVAQERPDSCAVACLRMLLAQRGEHVSEPELVRKTTLDKGGLTPEELAALSRACGLPARERIVNDDELADLVAGGRYPIVYLYRKFLDGVKNVHAVIPIRFSRQFVTLLDPLRGKRRVSLRKFAQARSIVQQWTVVVDDASLQEPNRTPATSV